MSDTFEARVEYVQPASRSELFIRIPYGLVLAIVGGLWGYAVELVTVIQWLHVLLTGRRNHALWKFTAAFLNFYASQWAYMSILTDTRPFTRGSPGGPNKNGVEIGATNGGNGVEIIDEPNVEIVEKDTDLDIDVDDEKP